MAVPDPGEEFAAKLKAAAEKFAKDLQRGFVKALKEAGALELVGVQEDGRPIYALDPELDPPSRVEQEGEPR